MVMAENAWRDENCPDYGYLYCEDCIEIGCDGAWYCDDIEMITEEVFNYYNSNDDMTINPEDDIEEEHYIIMINYCDSNMDGNIDHCEVFDCVMVVENEWRLENCPESFG
jgi:hypothetical protein